MWTLRAHASLALSHRRGAAGDVVTIVGVGAWPLLQGSHGHHEQVFATVGGHDALPRHPSSSAVHRVRASGGSGSTWSGGGGDVWNVELAIPTGLTAGEHTITLSLDRTSHDDAEVHGTVALDGTSTATVPVVPAVREVRPYVEGGVSLLLLRGSGFSLKHQDNLVHVGSVPCVVRNATENLIKCELAEWNAVGEAAGVSAGAAQATAANMSTAGPGLTVHEQLLRSDDEACLLDLRVARDAAHCAADGSMPIRAELRQQLVFPHHTVERHSVETYNVRPETSGLHLHERDSRHVRAFIPPA